MSKSQLCFWFCFTDICMKIASFLYVLVFIANNSLNFATPGFLRAGDSAVIFYTLRPLSVSTDNDMWQGVSSCLGFLLRRASWHPQWCCKMIILI